MTLKPPRLGELVAGASGAVLFCSLFLPWYRTPSGSAISAWDAFTVLDLVLAGTALIGMLLLVLEITQPTPAISVSVAALAALLGAVATLWVLLGALDPPGAGDERELVLLGLAASGGVLVGGLVGMRDEGTSFLPGEEPAPRA